ncbi:hypothetical protein HYU11_05030 [Candidatus Woesearchaeota archaeon]|nr:hypothetical protein [Candidatus Woesearchaeota archaeon]
MEMPIPRKIARAYEDIVRRKKTAPFIIFIFFIISFAIARLVVITFEGAALIVRQYHIHHFYYGITLISIAAWIGLVSNKEKLLTLASALFGIGLGLITDEIGLLLTCNSEGLNCDYFARGSFDAAVLISLFFLAVLYFHPFWRRASRLYKRIKGRGKPF